MSSCPPEQAGHPNSDRSEGDDTPLGRGRLALAGEGPCRPAPWRGTLTDMGKALLGLLLVVVAVEMIAVVVVGVVLVLLGNTQTTVIGVGMMFAAVIAAILTWRFARRPV
jgi:hypothetical protein